MGRPSSVVVYVPGARWSDIAGTDRRLVEALAESFDVLWVEPPSSFASPGADRRRSASSLIDAVAPGVLRVRTTMPGFSRPVLSGIADWLTTANVRAALGQLGAVPAGIVLAAPMRRFPRGIHGRRVLYVTDDWVAGARMMGLGASRVERSVARSAREADTIAAVSAELGEAIATSAERPFLLLPNGCSLPQMTGGGVTREPIAGLVGQLNERLDLDVLEEVHRRGVQILVVGPRTERDPHVRRRLDAFLASPGVEWVGNVPADEVPEYLSRMTVGMTPYADSAFNRASFPLKTLEYLASGLHTVSTDLPSARWLATELVQIAGDADAFADAVVAAVATPGGDDARASRRTFAASHSWRARAEQLLGQLGVAHG